MRKNQRYQTGKIPAGFAAVALMVALVWMGRTRPIAQNSAQTADAATYQAAAWPVPTPEPVNWPRNGQGDLFSPGILTDDPAHKRTGEMNLKLVAVGAEPFRVQLTGYVGRPDDYRATLSAINDARCWVVKAGQALPELGLVVRSISVATQPVKHADDWPIVEAMATVVVWDERTNLTVVLATGRQAMTGKCWAELETGKERVDRRRYHEGDAVEIGGKNYRVGPINLTPASVVLQPDASADGSAHAAITLRY